MITLDDIVTAIGLGEAYYSELIAEDVAALKINCCPPNKNKVKCLNRLLRALKWDVSVSVLDDITIGLYDLLLSTISSYTGAALAYDPNVVIPGNPVVVEETGSSVEYDYTEANLVLDDNDIYYLPFVKPNGDPFEAGSVPIQLLIDGVGNPIMPNYNFSPMRLGGFGNNAPQTISLTVFGSGNTPLTIAGGDLPGDLPSDFPHYI